MNDDTIIRIEFRTVIDTSKMSDHMKFFIVSEWPLIIECDDVDNVGSLLSLERNGEWMQAFTIFDKETKYIYGEDKKCLILHVDRNEQFEVHVFKSPNLRELEYQCLD